MSFAVSKANGGEPGGNDATADDLFGFDLVSLVSSAAQLRTSKTAFVQAAPVPDSANAGNSDIDYTSLRTLVNSYASAFRAFGLQPGERILIAGCLGVRAQAALISGLAAGLDTAVAGVHLDASDLGNFARLTGAVAVVTEVCAAQSGAASQILSAAAQADAVRLVISLSDDAPDGTVPMGAAGAASGRTPNLQRSPRILTRTLNGKLAAHSQQTLIAAGLDLIARTRISAGAPIVSTIVPASFAGLVCGPVAALLSGAPLVLHAPFDSKTLLQRIRELRPVQLMIPAAISAHLAASTVFNSTHLSALIVLSRFEGNPSALEAPPAPVIQAENVDICDLVAWDETALAAHCRGQDGAPGTPLTENHVIQVGGRNILAVRAVRHFLNNNGTSATAIAFDGEAVSVD